MTKEEFNDCKFHKGMQAKYYGDVRNIIGVNFVEKLIGLADETSDEIEWVRCENIALIK